MDREPYEAVVIGSLSLSGLLQFREEPALEALALGMPVWLYSPGLPESPRNRALAGRLSGACRELKALGVRFTEGAQKRLITAQEARDLRDRGLPAPENRVLTPLAREILEGSD